MIIRSLAAENLLKYRTLRLEQLPEQGVIAVSGDNETGKSAIGEIICFAMFGRTYSLDASQIGKLVRWGAGRGSVTMRFAAGGRDYEVTRHVERGGEQSVRLVACDHAQDPLARGADLVQAYLGRLLGYGFDAYIETFYLAQREINAPHPHSPAVKKMAGVDPLEHCAQDFSEEIERAEESAHLLVGRIEEVESDLGSLGEGPAELADLKKSVKETGDGESELSAHLDDLTQAADAYCSACRGRRSHGFRRGLASLLSALLLLGALVVGGFWGLLRVQPELWPLPALREWLDGELAATGLTLETALIYGVVAIGGLLILAWLWSFVLGLGARRRGRRGRRLADELQRLDELGPIGDSAAPDLTEDALTPGGGSLEGDGLVDRPDSERRFRLAQRVLTMDASPREVRAAVQHETAWMTRQRERLSVKRKALETSLAAANKDIEKTRQYTNRKEELSKQLEDSRAQIATRKLACKLLDGAALRMYERFSDQLRSTVAKNLPQLTEGRYEHVQVDQDLQVRVYSADKRSFLELEEISSGTQRQILLALRLALAQELVMRAVRDRQFSFLDEPFAFFDGVRMRGALRLLPSLSEDIVQHWVVAQRFPQDTPIALELACGGHPDTLEFGQAAMS